MKEVALDLIEGNDFIVFNGMLVNHAGDILRLSSREKTLYLDYILIQEENRRKGRGSQIIALLKHLAEKHGYDEIKIIVAPNFGVSEEKLKAFYERNGFKSIGDKEMILKTK